MVRHAADKIQPRSNEKIPMTDKKRSYTAGKGTSVISANCGQIFYCVRGNEGQVTKEDCEKM